MWVIDPERQTHRRWYRGLVRLLVSALIAAIGWPTMLAAQAFAQPPALTAPLVLDGPSADILGLSGLSVARDGTGGLVYLKTVAGVAHVFVSRLAGGVFQAPVQVDAELAGASAQPVIAAGNGGVLLTAFVNGGLLYVVDVAGAAAPFGQPIALLAGASNPAIAATNLGKAYIAFTAADGAGTDVRSAYYYDGVWALEPTPLNVLAADDAGTGTGRPQVAPAGDGVAIVVWGEQGHVYSRRVWGTAPSVVYEQADVPSLAGWTEISAGNPSIGSGGNSSYADVVFDELLTNGSQQQSRVLTRQLVVSQYQALSGADGLATPDLEGADQAQIATSEYNRGIVTSARDASNEVYATVLGDDGVIAQATARLDSLANATPPYAVPATTGYSSGIVAWQHDPGPGGVAEIRASYFDGSSFEPEMVLSSPSLGPTDAASGLAAAGDIVGDVAIAWVQGTGPSTQIVTAEVLVGPGSFAPDQAFGYVDTTTPVLAWSAPRQYWGGVLYRVSVDGALVAETTNTLIAVPLPQGPVSWQVTAVNSAGLTSTMQAAEVWVDTVPPAVTLSLSGKQQAGSALHAEVTYTDAPPPEPAADAAGIASVVISWGDGSVSPVADGTGSVYAIAHQTYHVYSKPGRYRLTVIATDRAANTTTLVRELKIAPKPKPKPKPRPKKRKRKPK